LLKIDGVPTRGQADRTVPAAVRSDYDEAMNCNGNGACFDWNPDTAMCPSWKATRERRHSPKGRAMLTKEWLRRLAAANLDPVAEAHRLRMTPAWRTFGARLRNTVARWRGVPDFSHAVKEAMDGCLSCKSCVGGCPIKVNVPGFRAKFLELYHGRYLRPAKDYLVATLEHLLPTLARMHGLYNGLAGGRIGRDVMRRLGLVDSPALTGVDLRRNIAARGVALATPRALRELSVEERQRSVVVVQDAYTSYFESQLVLDVLSLLQRLGYRPWLAPYRPNGKALHIHGFLGAFEKVARRGAVDLRALAATGVSLVGVDPAMTLTYRDEYVEALGAEAPPKVLLLQEWLATRISQRPRSDEALPYRILPHCTEHTTVAGATKDWVTVFDRLGLKLDILSCGCCGMAGTYGHATKNRDSSQRIYESSWKRHVDETPDAERLLATGYSCRSQVKRFSGVLLPHPAQVLLAVLRDAAG
jgi:Fe-S oxidoreductase